MSNAYIGPQPHLSKPANGRRLRDAADTPRQAARGFFTVHQGDARRLELVLSQHSSQAKPLLSATITSPPYGGLKNYGDPSQIGYGQPWDEYLMDLRRVFRATFKHTKPDGCLWLVADTLRQRARDGQVWRLEMLPFRLAAEAEREGWILRDIVIWVKDKTLPWSSRGRMRNGFEYVLFLVKSAAYKYHVDRLREPSELEQWWVRYPERYNPQGKAPSNVWAVPIPVQGSWANTAIQHACPLPADLVERMMLLSTDEQDVVLDPFAGSGVVVAEAQRLGRRGLGVELIDRHIRAFHETVLPAITERRGVDVVQELHKQSVDLQRTILALRAVKYPKVLMRTVREIDPTLPTPLAAYALRSKQPEPSGPLRVAVVVVLREQDRASTSEYLNALLRASRRRPASKFGISPTLSMKDENELPGLHRGRQLYGYVSGRTHQTVGRCTIGNLYTLAMEPSRYSVPLIVSNVEVNEHPRKLRSPAQ